MPVNVKPRFLPLLTFLMPLLLLGQESGTDDMLTRKVPDMFQQYRLLMQVNPDSTWQVYEGDSLLSTMEVFSRMEDPEAGDRYNTHLKSVQRLETRARQVSVLSIAGTTGGLFYLLLTAERDLIETIPGYLILGFSLYKWREGRILNKALQRELYFLANVMPPHRVQAWVDDYNLLLYQHLSEQKVQFHVAP